MIEKSAIKDVPKTAGVYRFLDKGRKVIYVGKAKNLAARLSFYLNKDIFIGKTANLIREARSVEWTKTETELESLILEAALIKKLRPKYNVSLKDDKSYAYLLFSRPTKLTSDTEYPKVTLVRKINHRSGTYFGPFPNGYSIKKILRMMRRAFPYRDCSASKFLTFRKLGHGCLLHDLSLCPAPCVLGEVSPRQYQTALRPLKMFFQGKGRDYIKQLRVKMFAAADTLDFEKAGEYKLLIEKIESIIARRLPAESYLSNPNLYEDLRTEELTDLENFLKVYFPEIKLTGGDRRIEAYDISNLGTSFPVGALVTFKDGEPQKDFYRRYKIKFVSGINDVGMMTEVIGRRLKNREIPFPDLILIDGGKSQLSHVGRLLSTLKLPYIGLAKRYERIVVGGQYVKLPKGRPLIKLLMRIRDETHRFAINYQRKSRLFV